MIAGFGLMFYAWAEATNSSRGAQPRFYFKCIPWAAFICFMAWFIYCPLELKVAFVSVIGELLQDELMTILQALFYLTGIFYFMWGNRR